MWNRYNVHKMFVNIYRNPKTQNWFRYETFIHLFEFNGFSTLGERQTQSVYTDCFYIVSSQPNQRAAPVVHKVFWPRPALNLDSVFFSNPKILSPHFRCVTSLPPSGLYSYLEFLFRHLWMTHPHRARVNTCVCTKLTHAPSRKVLILTKPKGKIYKTKSLRNFIT